MTLGLTDVTPSQKLIDLKAELITEQYKACDDLIELYNQNKLSLRPGCNAEKTLETDLTKILNEVRDTAGKNCSKNLDPKNSALLMAVCGSKGSNLNLSQMITCLGQQTISGCRIGDGFSRRTMPHFLLDSVTPESRGFIKNSFYDGLEATEFFFHTMGGREGLIDTAVKTADTGYMQRRLIKALEDVVICYDFSVRNSEDCIIQFKYGDDGLDPISMETDACPINLDRLLKYCRTYYPLRDGPPHNELTLTSAEARKQIDLRMAELVAGEELSSKFLEYIEQFMDDVVNHIESLHQGFKENFDEKAGVEF
jgi:DNA-directed RNA polymerase III subunit RPC1